MRFLQCVKHGKKNRTYVFENRAALESKGYKECSKAEQQIRRKCKGGLTKEDKCLNQFLTSEISTMR